MKKLPDFTGDDAMTRFLLRAIPPGLRAEYHRNCAFLECGKRELLSMLANSSGRTRGELEHILFSR